MTTKSEQKVNDDPKISIDWWAVIFALSLAVVVFAGLKVTW